MCHLPSFPVPAAAHKCFHVYQQVLLKCLSFQGFNNDMKAAMDQVDQEYLEEVLKTTGTDGEASVSTDVKVKDTSLTIDEILVRLFISSSPSNQYNYDPYGYIMIPP